MDSENSPLSIVDDQVFDLHKVTRIPQGRLEFEVDVSLESISKAVNKKPKHYPCAGAALGK